MIDELYRYYEERNGIRPSWVKIKIRYIVHCYENFKE